ncbi:glutamine amidotransferase [Roseibacterium sp. SDUM158016]|uniref:glutamine amidotransferase-related protein n=1 Tax=Roseicyclus sediminis TaxID=2980997 RepID=UPI0021D074BA|nr:glutamine amidotransferase [Roseibacterium sp. SDUM158016]MCU4651799.1 glutamine amidotransferase [Roseibacterium sp. SDUM158016]
MTRRILLISHNPPPMIDRAHAWLHANGHAVEVVRPHLGDPLPERPGDYAGTIVYGGRFNADSEDVNIFLRDEYRWIAETLEAGRPILGICLGAQMIARHMGAAVGPLPDGRVEFGFYEVRPVAGAEDFLPAPLTVTQSHFHGFDLPAGAERLAESDLFPNQAFRAGPAVLGLQFHPEATAEQFRQWQAAYPGHYRRPGCQDRARQEALIEAAQAPQAAWFEALLAAHFGKGGASQASVPQGASG